MQFESNRHGPTLYWGLLMPGEGGTRWDPQTILWTQHEQSLWMHMQHDKHTATLCILGPDSM